MIFRNNIYFFFNLALYLVIWLALYLDINLPHSDIYGSARNFDIVAFTELLADGVVNF